MSDPIKEEEEVTETDNTENPENPDQEVITKLDTVLNFPLVQNR